MDLRGVSVLHFGYIIIDQTGHRMYRRGVLLGMEEMEVLRRMRCDDGVLREAHRLVDDGGLVHRHDSPTLHLQYWHRRQGRDHVTHPEFANVCLGRLRLMINRTLKRVYIYIPRWQT